MYHCAQIFGACLLLTLYPSTVFCEHLIDMRELDLMPSKLDSLIERVRPKQQVCVSGSVSCEAEPDKVDLGAVIFKMWDTDKFNPDDFMGKNFTNDGGKFQFCGKARDPYGNIDPILKIYHKCEHHEKCWRVQIVTIPKSSIGSVHQFSEPLKLGPNSGRAEKIKCLNKETLADKAIIKTNYVLTNAIDAVSEGKK